MGAANPLWGAPRIHGELSKLGIDVSERTVSRLLRRRDRPPSQTWRTFLTNHATSLVSMDFFTVPTLTGRVLFVLVLLAVHGELPVVPANTPERTCASLRCFNPAHIGIVVRSQPKDEDTRGVQSVDTSRDTNSPPKPSHADHAAIGV